MKNLKFIFRMFSRNPLLIFVNLPGLAIGLSAVLLLTIYLRHELSFDKHFPTKNNVLRLYNSISQNGKTSNYGICLRKSYVDIPQNIPEIKASTQIYRGWKTMAEYNNKKFSSLDLLYADKDFFDVFGLDLIYGDKNTALVGDRQVVLDVSTAEKIFNRQDCIGEVITVSEEPHIITGVIKDLPVTTHFEFNLLASMESVKPERMRGLEFFTYFLVSENTNIEVVAEKIEYENDKIIKPFMEQFGFTSQSGTELLSNLHLYSAVDFDLSSGGNPKQILIVAGIAFLILVIAIINYLNLYILHGEKRISEIAARRSLGANQRNLSRLFFTETGIIGIFAFAIALLLTSVLHPHFASLMQRDIELSDFLSLSGILLIIAILAILILASGSYPSYYLSRFNLVNALKGNKKSINSKSRLSRISVIIQFSVTVFLLSSLSIVYAQLRYMKNVPLGFNPENVIGITGLTPEIRKSYSAIQNELEQFSFISSAGSSDHKMGQGSSGQGIKKLGDPGNYQSVNQYRINPGFCKTMEMEIIDGRFFNTSESDKKSIILNEAAVKMLGLENPVGKMIDMGERPLKIIAVVKDFYYIDHPGEPIAPLVLTNYSDRISTFYARLTGEYSKEKQLQVDALLKSYSPDYISSYFNLTDVYANKYYKEERVMKLISTGALFALLISFIGLMALSVLNVNRKIKEIGIRKVMGSTEFRVILSLLTETFILIGIAIIIAFGFSYVAMQNWLTGFASHIQIKPAYFLVNAIFAFLVGILAVGWQSWKAATRNPVESLRYE